jgi:glutamate-ammonia-ligase adenylyltransferase
MDIEFAVQMLQLQHAAENPAVLVPGTLEAIEHLQQAGYLSADDGSYFQRAYRFLRRVEAHLRLMNTTARHDLPEDETELRKLAFLLGYSGATALAEECHQYTAENRRRFQRLFDQAAQV